MKTIAVVFAVVSAASGAAARQPASAADEQKADKQADKRIEARLRNDRGLKDNRIAVQVEDGVATLKGRVDDENERAAAEKAAYVNGVTRVDDWLSVDKPHEKKPISDDAVTARILARYRPDKTLETANISVTTTRGVVTLDGLVPSETARRRAIQIAEEAGGAKRVEDSLRIVGETEPPQQVSAAHGK
jgi:osmotically-inducible protein OsmY